jgi:hypothetical protein
MMRRPPRPILLCLAASVLSGWLPAFAQDGAAESRYQVELVVFRHLDGSRTTPEIANPTTATPPATATATQAARYPAPGGARRLDRIAEQIRNLQAYGLIRQLAWEQTAAPLQQAEAADLGAMGLDRSQVIGTALLYGGRYLHLELRLTSLASGATIESSRRIRLNEVHYFDNPEFGVLALVTRAD